MTGALAASTASARPRPCLACPAGTRADGAGFTDAPMYPFEGASARPKGRRVDHAPSAPTTHSVAGAASVVAQAVVAALALGLNLPADPSPP